MHKRICLAHAHLESPSDTRLGRTTNPYFGKTFWMKALTCASGDELASNRLGALVASWEFVLVAWLAHTSITETSVRSSEALAAKRTRETVRMKLLITNISNVAPDRLEASCAFWKPSVIASCAYLFVFVREMFPRD